MEVCHTHSPDFEGKFDLEHRHFGVLLADLLADSKHLGLRTIEHVRPGALVLGFVWIHKFALFANETEDHISQLTRKLQKVASIAAGGHDDRFPGHGSRLSYEIRVGDDAGEFLCSSRVRNLQMVRQVFQIPPSC